MKRGKRKRREKREGKRKVYVVTPSADGAARVTKEKRISLLWLIAGKMR